MFSDLYWLYFECDVSIPNLMTILIGMDGSGLFLEVCTKHFVCMTDGITFLTNMEEGTFG